MDRLAPPQTWKLDRPRDRGAGGSRLDPADQSQVSPFSPSPNCPGMARRSGPSGGRQEGRIATHALLAFLSWRGEGSPLASMTTSSKPRKMRFESGKTSTRKTENLAHLTYPHTECGMRKKSRLGHLCASVHEAMTLYQR